MCTPQSWPAWASFYAAFGVPPVAWPTTFAAASGNLTSDVSSLLRDGIRTVARLLRQADAYVQVVWSDHSRRAKRRALKISNAKSMKGRLPAYRDLLKICAKTLGYVEAAMHALSQAADPRAAVLLHAMSTATDLLRRVYDQTERRVLGGENVPASEKVMSVFEPHTDLILKGGREPQYGHKVAVLRCIEACSGCVRGSRRASRG